MILRLVAVRLALVATAFAGVLVAAGAVLGLDCSLTRCWPSLDPADGLVFSLTAPWAVVLFAFLLTRVVRLTDRVPRPDGLGRPLASGGPGGLRWSSAPGRSGEPDAA